MSKHATKSNYRRDYEIYLGSFIPANYHVHHIDHDRDNNLFSNLVAIPNSLHGRYHFYERISASLLRNMPERPDPELVEKFKIEHWRSGEWASNYDGNIMDYFLICDSIRWMQKEYDEAGIVLEKFNAIKNEVLAYKQQQLKRA